MKKTLDYLSRIIVIAWALQTIAGIYIVVWNPDLITELYSKIWVSLAITSFFLIAILSTIQNKKP